MARILRESRLPRESVPTRWLTDADVWAALLESMPLTAMIRNLATMTRVGLLASMSEAVGTVATHLADAERLRRSRVHPVSVLAALVTYAQGHGQRSTATWAPVAQIIDALDGAFYASFPNVETTGRRFVLACDVSGSMGSGSVSGIPGLTPRVATGALALVASAREPKHVILGFATEIRQLSISPRQRLDDVTRYMASIPMGGTDCAQPMLWALANKVAVDVFVVLTDSETWAGTPHPAQALVKYRRQSGINAKLVVVGMTSAGFTIADPNDAGMLDCVGFDTATPQVLAEFARG